MGFNSGFKGLTLEVNGHLQCPVTLLLWKESPLPTPNAHLIVDWLDAVDGWDA